MRVIKDRKIVDDDWTLLAPDAPIPEHGDVIVSLAQWNALVASANVAAADDAASATPGATATGPRFNPDSAPRLSPPAPQPSALTAQLPARAGRIGVVLHSDERPEQIQQLERLPLIAINFPKFGDGRGYTSARLLRARLGFRGELRAVGDVLRDQLFYMARCGIDSFALKAGKDIEGALSAFDDFSVAYQAAADDPRPLFRRIER